MGRLICPGGLSRCVWLQLCLLVSCDLELCLVRGWIYRDSMNIEEKGKKELNKVCNTMVQHGAQNTTI